MIETDVTLSGGGYLARLSSGFGGACYSLSGPQGEEILRTPADKSEWEKTPFLFGNPILFPPNRIRGGQFVFENVTYSFPVNEKETGAHLHGELYRRSFCIVSKDDSGVTFSFSAREGEYLGFPHAFTINRRYRLDSRGLSEETEVINRSERNMPFMLAFHTTFNLFFDGGSMADCRLCIPVGREQVRNERYLPTGEWKKIGERERKLSAGEYAPDENLSALYEARGNRIRIDNRKTGKSIVYEADERYRYRMLWKRAEQSFVVTEPETAAIDCFHLDKSPGKYGLLVVPPHGRISLGTRVFIGNK